MLRMLALWVVFSVVAGFLARARGRSLITWLLIALLVSPLIAAVLLLSIRNLAIEDTPQPQPSRKSRFFRNVLNILMAVAVLGIFYGLFNRGPMPAIKLF